MQERAPKQTQTVFYFFVIFYFPRLTTDGFCIKYRLQNLFAYVRMFLWLKHVSF